MTLDGGTLTKALVVSMLWGAIATSIISIVTASYTAQSPGLEMYQATGLEAARMMISQFGFIGFLKGLLGWYVLMVASIFIGCVIFGAWTRRPSPHDA
jgi:hypothetical protein